MNEGDHISYAPTYEEGKYFDRYDSGKYKNEAGTEYKYYFHDPDRNASDGKKRPLLVFFHGTSNSLVGELCIAYSGGECYASEEYQKSMGGAHVLIPLANEYRDEDGNVQGYWSEELLSDAHGVIQEYVKKRSDRIGQIFLFGNSSGATFCMRLMEAYMDFYDAAIPMGSESLPDDATLDEYERKGKWLFYAVGKRDEFHDYAHDIAPRIPKLEQMKHCFIYTPDWVRNGDKGVASIMAGIEMGQHCIVNALHCNLMFDDGTPMDQRLPVGVTGWIADCVRETGNEGS